MKDDVVFIYVYFGVLVEVWFIGVVVFICVV